MRELSSHSQGEEEKVKACSSVMALIFPLRAQEPTPSSVLRERSRAKANCRRLFLCFCRLNMSALRRFRQREGKRQSDWLWQQFSLRFLFPLKFFDSPSVLGCWETNEEYKPNKKKRKKNAHKQKREEKQNEHFGRNGGWKFKPTGFFKNSYRYINPMSRICFLPNFSLETRPFNTKNHNFSQYYQHV